MKKILIADDSDTLRAKIASFLTEEGYSVLTAGDGAEAIKIIKSNSDIDLILLDIEMPTLDGFDVLRMIRGGRLAPETPTLALTGVQGDPSIIAKLKSFGASGYVSKNIPMQELHFRIKSMLFPNSSSH